MPSSRPQQRIPVLTWHGYNVFGDRYDNNDLIAFAADLRVIKVIVQRTKDKGNGFRALIHELVQSELFQTK